VPVVTVFPDTPEDVVTVVLADPLQATFDKLPDPPAIARLLEIVLWASWSWS
jgi:hypothetical protein